MSEQNVTVGVVEDFVGEIPPVKGRGGKGGAGRKPSPELTQVRGLLPGQRAVFTVSPKADESVQKAMSRLIARASRVDFDIKTRTDKDTSTVTIYRLATATPTETPASV